MHCNIVGNFEETTLNIADDDIDDKLVCISYREKVIEAFLW